MKNSLWAALAAVLWMAMPAGGDPGDERILLAKDAARAGDRVRLASQAQPTGHVLDPYPEYWVLSSQLARNEADPARLKDFLERNRDSWLAEKLRGEWLRGLGKRNEWGRFIAEYSELQQPEQDLQCYQHQVRISSGDPVVLAEVRPLWFSLVDTPESCIPVLRALVQEALVSPDEIWLRVRRLMEAKRLSGARAVAAWLPPEQAPLPSDLERAGSNPAVWLDRMPANFAVSRPGRELALIALVRVARDDPKGAYLRYARLDERFSAEERSYALGQIAWQAASKLQPEAHEWFKAAGDTPMSDEQAAWRVRAALRAGDWKTVRAGVEAMAPGQRDLPDWSYWYGRALQALGQREGARKAFERIAGHPTFYSILADEELGRVFTLPSKARAIHRDELEQVRQTPGLQRALALLRLDMRTEGIREWNWTLRNKDDRFLLAAAQLAQDLGIYDRAIYAADRTRNEHDYSLRYLTPHRERIEPNARSRDLDTAWVYGLMRQESRFITSARSSVGAQGLMQVMPSTGQWIAGKLGMKGYNVSWLRDPDTNVMFGTTYMRMVLEGLDNHPVLASAAYNAGPGRAKRWKDAKPLEGAIYAETIPFGETRDYVKKVMANAVIYSALLEGRAPSLKARLGTISPSNGDFSGYASPAPGAGLE
ncbi:lytic transglycosylase domain-containing protein [Zoogloea sp.]|uniref:lytic transglycosylase domain-containing protein n=1 Tax=Zoogloea sp. TaxID=49181 RepID=UPI00262D0E10|nr:lytic transglycosylase domain-containing protein [Zoogloea sp.]MDD3352688.1 transglycosylase SLT domain-containing protein [Zoogloea sp.]